MATEFFCPLCSKNIGFAMDVLGDPLQVWEMHMMVHIRDAQGDIWQYLLEHRDELPAELQQLESRRIDVIKQMCIQKTQLEMMIDDGSL